MMNPAFGPSLGVPAFQTASSLPRFGAGEHIPDCKGSRFITTNRYAPNEAWAATMEDLAAGVEHALNTGHAGSGQALIDRISLEYHRRTCDQRQKPAVPSAEPVATAKPKGRLGRWLQGNAANNSKVDLGCPTGPEAWGTPRAYLECIPADSMESLKRRCTQIFARKAVKKGEDAVAYGHFSYVKNGAGEIVSRLEDPSRKELACGLPNDQVVNYTYEIDGKPVTVFRLQPMLVNGESVLSWVFAPPAPEVMDAIADLTEKALALKDAPRTQKTLDLAVETVATLHWLFALTMPYQRGSAGSADVLTKVLFDHLGIQTGNWKDDFSPDIEAFCTPDVKDFAKHYAGFFTEAPRFSKAPIVSIPAQAKAGQLLDQVA